jgi:hypothetical protein
LAATALNRLGELYWHPIYAYARAWGKNRHEAEDLTRAFFQELIENHKTPGPGLAYATGMEWIPLSSPRDYGFCSLPVDKAARWCRVIPVTLMQMIVARTKAPARVRNPQRSQRHEPTH